MIVTRRMLEKKYDEFNERYFDDELPDDMSVCPNPELGAFGEYTELYFQEYDETYPVIFINEQFNYAEDDINILLLHEMVHAYIALKDIKIEDSHGKAFQELAHKIEEKSGYEDIITGVKFVKYRNKTFYIIIINQNESDIRHIATFTDKNIFKWYVDFFKNRKEDCSIKVDSFEIYKSQYNCFDSFEITDKIVNLSCDKLENKRFEEELLPLLTKITRIK